jgi:hypothetical protein
MAYFYHISPWRISFLICAMYIHRRKNKKKRAINTNYKDTGKGFHSLFLLLTSTSILAVHYYLEQPLHVYIPRWVRCRYSNLGPTLRHTGVLTVQIHLIPPYLVTSRSFKIYMFCRRTLSILKRILYNAEKIAY